MTSVQDDKEALFNHRNFRVGFNKSGIPSSLKNLTYLFITRKPLKNLTSLKSSKGIQSFQTLSYFCVLK